MRLAELMAAGTPVGDPAVQAVIAAQYEDIRRFWTPDSAACKGLGRMFADDPRWRSVHDRVAEGLAEYRRDAMTVYADTVLS